MNEGERRKKPVKMVVPVDVWKCDDLRELIKDRVRAHVKDVELAKRLEQALGEEVAYGDGGGGNVGVV